MATAAHHTTDSYTDEIEELFDYRVIEQPATTSGHHSMIIGYGNQAFADHGGELVNRNGSESLGRAAHTPSPASAGQPPPAGAVSEADWGWSASVTAL